MFYLFPPNFYAFEGLRFWGSSLLLFENQLLLRQTVYSAIVWFPFRHIKDTDKFLIYKFLIYIFTYFLYLFTFVYN